MKETRSLANTTNSTSKQIEQFVFDLDEEISKSHPLVRSFISEQHREIVKLQAQLAKSKVQFDSEKARIEADCTAKIFAANAPKIILNFGDVNSAKGSVS